jgi:hypothetical protein
VGWDTNAEVPLPGMAGAPLLAPVSVLLPPGWLLRRGSSRLAGAQGRMERFLRKLSRMMAFRWSGSSSQAAR